MHIMLYNNRMIYPCHRVGGYFSSYEGPSHHALEEETEENVSLMSWNILSPDLTEQNPSYYRDIANVHEVNPYVVDKMKRINHIKQILSSKMMHNQIICLQEVSESTIPMLREICDSFSYSYVHDTADRRLLGRTKTDKTLRNMLGLAILFPNRRFSKVAAHNLAPFGGPPVVVDPSLLQHLETSLSDATLRLKTAPNSEKRIISEEMKDLRERIRNIDTVPDVTQRMKDRGVLLIVLQDIQRPHIVFAIATTHVPCDYSNESLMKEYAIRIKVKMDDWMRENINSKLEHKVPLLFCGDMNSGVDSPFYNEFLRDSDFQDVFGASRDETMCTLYSFSQNRVNDGFTTPHSLILDHMFIPHSGIQVIDAKHPIVPTSHIPLPNEDWPSDHLAVEIVFRIAPTSFSPSAEPNLILN